MQEAASGATQIVRPFVEPHLMTPARFREPRITNEITPWTITFDTTPMAACFPTAVINCAKRASQRKVGASPGVDGSL